MWDSLFNRCQINSNKYISSLEGFVGQEEEKKKPAFLLESITSQDQSSCLLSANRLDS